MGLAPCTAPRTEARTTSSSCSAAAAPDSTSPDKEGRTPYVWAEGVFLATNSPVAKPSTMALIKKLLESNRGNGQAMKRRDPVDAAVFVAAVVCAVGRRAGRPAPTCAARAACRGGRRRFPQAVLRRLPQRAGKSGGLALDALDASERRGARGGMGESGPQAAHRHDAARGRAQAGRRRRADVHRVARVRARSLPPHVSSTPERRRCTA